jgi:uncharacterized GH25 family protein
MRDIGKRAAALALWALIPTGTSAHDLKILASNQAVAEPGGKTTVYLSWGHRLPIDDLIDGSTLERFEILSPTQAATTLTRDGLGVHAQSVPLKDAGLHQAVVVRKASVFTYIIDEDGNRVFKRGPKSAITEGKIDTANRSIMTAKAMIAVGPGTAEPIKPLGLACEITPVDGPTAWRTGRELRLRIEVDGKPVSTAEVTARPVGFKPDNAWNYSTHADKQGVATILPDRAGTWVVRVNVKRPAPESARADYDQESFTTTLSLEVQP